MKNLESKRLSLRLIVEADLPEIHELHSIPEVDKYNTLGIPKDFDETKRVMKPLLEANKKEEIDYYTCAIEQKDDGAFVGLIALVLSSKKFNSAEVWFKLNSIYWGKGYATEALTVLINFGFTTLKLHRIGAGCAVDNKASAAVLKKVGMQLEGRHRKILPLKSGWSDNFEYAILESDVKSEM